MSLLIPILFLQVTLEVLSYHSSASTEELKDVAEVAKVPMLTNNKELAQYVLVLGNFYIFLYNYGIPYLT